MCYYIDPREWRAWQRLREAERMGWATTKWGLGRPGGWIYGKMEGFSHGYLAHQLVLMGPPALSIGKSKKAEKGYKIIIMLLLIKNLFIKWKLVDIIRAESNALWCERQRDN